MNLRSGVFVSLFVCSLSGTFQVRNSPDPGGPKITSHEISRVHRGAPYAYQVTAVDSAGRQLFYIAKDLPNGLSFDPIEHEISGSISVPGQYPMHVYAIAGQDTVRQFYMLTVFDRHTTNILCLGNSITNGTTSFNSYRRDLWFLLHDDKYDFDLIGSWSKHHMGTDVPDPDFDLDHEGHSGWTIQDMFHAPDWDSSRGNIYIWLQTYYPDIVLVELGTNDVFHCTKVPEMISDMAKLVGLLREKNPRVTVCIAQIPPLGPRWADQKLCGTDTTYDEVLRNFNKAIPGLVARLNTRLSPIITVDQYTGVDPTLDMYDDIHPNDRGEKMMADRWFKVIKRYLHPLPGLK
jgi:acyl-CoA thioesterase-1